jgi:uridylate kinase
LTNDLNVMDASAIALAKDNDIPIIVFSIKEQGEFPRVVKGEGVFTIVRGEKSE